MRSGAETFARALRCAFMSTENVLVAASRNTFALPFDRIEAEQVEPAIRQLLEEAKREVDAIATDSAAPTYASLLTGLEDALEPLSRALGMVGHLESVATTPALREVYSRLKPEVSAFFASIYDY